MSGPTVIGLDASLASSGVAVWRDGLWTFDTIRTRPDMDVEDRWAVIAEDVGRRVHPYRTVVVLEAVFAGLRGGLELAMLHGVLRHVLHEADVPTAVVVTQHLKQFATGKGKATKQQMLAAAKDRLGVPLSSHDQADACWLACMGLHRYGSPLVPTTTVQDAACRAGRWPQWSLT